jgi:SAM-dependent methyltransferase
VGTQRGARFYDGIYARSRSYDGPIERLPWFELYCAAAAWATAQRLNILELGCGPGWLASLLSMVSCRHFDSYVGIDFSNTALKQAAARVPDKRFVFLRRDLNKARLKFAANRAIVAAELLEHLEGDRELVAKLPGDSPLWFSVARFDARGHVRHFENASQVAARYGDVLTGLHITERERWFIGTAVIPRRGRTGRP